MGWMEFPQDATVLELGCAEADWQTPMLTLRPDLQITGIDVRKCRRPGTVIRGDLLEHEFPDRSFDAIVAVSCLEWVGMAHYGDSRDTFGDVRAMSRCARWLKPSGWMYLDVPYRPTLSHGVSGGKLRGYSPEALHSRLIDGHFVEQHRQVFEPDHRDGPYVALHLTPQV